MRQKRVTVSEWMTEEPVTTTPQTRLVDVYAAMSNADVRRLPVVDDEGSVIGMITLSDVQRARPYERSLSDEDALAAIDASVADLMAYDPETVSPDDPIEAAAERMLEFQISGLPVVDGDQLVGIITESDIFKGLVEDWTRETA